jgi:ferredoxin, 2Fe-2S
MMGKVTFIASDGTNTLLDDIPDGTSMMHAALLSDISGIVGECGGSQMCATCHVYVPDEWLAKLAPMQDPENAMLDSAACERKHNSRLSCQIVMSPAIDGIVLHMPERQI